MNVMDPEALRGVVEKVLADLGKISPASSPAPAATPKAAPAPTPADVLMKSRLLPMEPPRST